MHQPSHRFSRNRLRTGHRRAFVLLVALTALSGVAMAGLALARTFTLAVAKNARVTNTARMTTAATILVNSRGHAVYTLTGDSAKHPECTQSNGCFGFWPPVTVASARKITHSPGVKGKLGTWRRDGFIQVTLNGHPLYTFSGDGQRDHATGEGLHTFGGTWHVSRASRGSTGSAGSQSQPPAAPGSTPTPTYPPY